MAEYILSCCSTADLSREHLLSRNIPYVCFHFFLNDEEKIDDLGISVPPKVLFDSIKALHRVFQLAAAHAKVADEPDNGLPE